jgi:hypothetical protein
MKIVALFGIRAYEPDLPELLVAWDEYSIDENGDGWEEEKDQRVNLIGDELIATAEIIIDVSEKSILSILRPQRGFIKGMIVA